MSLSTPLYATITETTDAPEELLATYVLQPGDSFVGSLEPGDFDVIAVELTAGDLYTFEIEGGGASSISDTVLWLVNEDGVFISFDDDSGAGFYSELTYGANATETYYVLVESYTGNETGSYQLNVTYSGAATIPPAASYQEMADYLTEGYWYDSGELPHTFDTSVTNVITVNLSGLDADGRQLALWALESWEMVADIAFVETSGSADITFDDSDTGAYASYYRIGNTTTSVLINVSTDWIATYGTTMDSYSLQTYIHEIGHALGLGHQGDYNGSATYLADADFEQDSWQTTIMSYFSQQDNPYAEADYALLATPMIVDILAIQDLYGATDGGETSGDTVWGFETTLTNYLGTYFMAALDGTGDSSVYSGAGFAMTIYDESGADLLNLVGSTTDDVVDMTSGSISSVMGLVGNVLIAEGTEIEDLVAGSGNDSISGNGLGNYIIAGGGDDTISAAVGWDTVEGEEGNDLIYGLDGYDSLLGGEGDDEITGNNGFDTLEGGDGRDTLTGGLGTDSLYGGDGADSLSGSSGSDRLFGDLDNDALYGNAGADELQGGEGSDNLNGGINHDLLQGETGNDTLNGNNGSDTLEGGSGDDVLSGNAGTDYLNGGSGSDVLNGGIGADSFEFYEGNDDDIVVGFQDNIDTLVIETSLLGGLDITQIGTISSVVDGNLVIDFGDGDTLTLNTITDASILYDDISLV